MNDTPILTTAEPQQSTALVVVPAGELPILLSNDKTDILGRLLADLAGYEPDASTEKGRREINAKKKRVGVAKMDFVRLAQTVTVDAKKIVDGARKEVQTMEKLMDGLRDRIGQPLAEYEEREKARVAEHEAAIATLESWAEVPAEWTSEQIAARIAELGNDPLLSRDWQEFAPRAAKAAKGAHNALVAARVAAEDRERAAAEEAARRAEEVERERVAAHDRALAAMEMLGAASEGMPLDGLHVRRAKVVEAYMARDWQEMTDDAQTVMIRVVAALDALIEAAKAREAEAQRQREQAAADRARVEAEARAAEEAAAAERRAQMADYHRRMLEHVVNCGLGFIDGEPQPAGILLRELEEKIEFTEDNFGDLLPDALEAQRVALGRIRSAMEVADRRRRAEDAAQAEREASAQREREAAEAAEHAHRQQQEAEERERQRAERAEAARIERHRSVIEALDTADRFQSANPTAATIQARIDQVSSVSLELDEFAQEGFDTREATLTRLRAMLAEAQERERREAEALAEQQQARAEAAAAAKLKAEQDAAKAEADRRALNKAHLARVNRDAAEAIEQAIVGVHSGNEAEARAIAKAVVVAIAKGEVPSVSISY